MKSNPLLKWLLIPMALLLVFVGIKLFSGAPGGQPAPKGAASTLTPEEMKAWASQATRRAIPLPRWWPR
ncbi:hypothetical protein [Rhodanobacter lindaniclasticus]